ncbi:hypothetical protein D3Z38_05190 [Clostridiales bacterium]|nr:hypothetical protein [Clostridiales bacterium]
MKQKSNRIIAVIFLLLIFVFGIGTLLKCGDVYQMLIEKGGPFSPKTEIEQSLQDNFKSRNNWINLNGLFQRAIGTTIVRDAGGVDVYKLENGHIAYNLEKQEMDTYAEKLQELYDYTQKRDVDFLYVQLPFKVENDDMMPIGTQEYGNDNADILLKQLSDRQIPAMDIRSHIKSEGFEYEELFFKTDQHWKPATALWAAGLVAKEIQDRYQVQTKDTLYNMNQYKVKTYRDWFLGSLGKRVGAWYDGTDDFDVIIPKFSTDFQFFAQTASGSIKRKGNFEKVMLKKEFIKTKDYFDLNTYAGYIGGDYALNTIENNMAPNNKKILLLRDSFSCAMLPYLALSADTVTAMDLRHYHDMSVARYLEKHQIDLVIVAYNPSVFSDQPFDFFGRIQ